MSQKFTQAGSSPPVALAGVMVNAETVQTTFDGLGTFTLLAGNFLEKEGLGHVTVDGAFNPASRDWMPAEPWVRVLTQIHRSIGDHVMRQIGGAIPRRAQFPAHINDVASALRSVDVAYHMNHALHGRPMFDPLTGTMQEGIGHYEATILGPNSARAESTSAYPCPFDMGIYSAMASRFAEGVSITHAPGECRTNSGSRCTYTVQWKAA